MGASYFPIKINKKETDYHHNNAKSSFFTIMQIHLASPSIRMQHRLLRFSSGCNFNCEEYLLCFKKQRSRHLICLKSYRVIQTKQAEEAFNVNNKKHSTLNSGKIDQKQP